MRKTGWTWAQLQETPENVLGYLRLIDEWTDKSAKVAAAMNAPGPVVGAIGGPDG